VAYKQNRRSSFGSSHYVRKPHPRCIRMKDRDTQIARLPRHVSHYRVIRDARPGTRPGASSISIHWRRALASYLVGKSLPLRRAAVTARSHRCGPGPLSVISKYNLRVTVRPYLSQALAHDKGLFGICTIMFWYK
jgi:hypothetical protein